MKINFKVIISSCVLATVLFIFYLGLSTTTQYNTKDMVGKKLNSSQIDSLTENILIENSFILINFWASWCLPCRKEHKHLLELKTNNKLTLVGINYKDKKKNASKFLKDLGNPYEYLKNDIEGKISVLFGIYGIPESILIDNNLKIIKKFIGPLNEKDYEKIINILN